MKKILILLLVLISVQGFGQIINDNTDVNTASNSLNDGFVWDGQNWVNLPVPDYVVGYPYIGKYINNFDNNSDGVGNFNGGSLVYDGGNSRIVVTTSGSSQGVRLDFTNTASTEYILIVDLETVTGGDVTVYSQWATSLGTFATGQHEIHFTSDATAGGFGNKIILALSSAGSFNVNSIEVIEVVPSLLIDIPDTILQNTLALMTEKTNMLYASNFEDGSLDYLSGFGLTVSIVGDQYIADPTTNGQIMLVGHGNSVDFDIPDYVDIYLDVEIIDSELRILPRWGGSENTSFITSGTGTYLFRLKKVGDNATAAINHIAITTVDALGGSIRINEIKVSTAPSIILNDYFVDIGKDTEIPALFTGVNIGNVAKSDNTSATTIGEGASTLFDGVFGVVGGSERLAIGEFSRSYGWRNTAVGAYAHAGGQSSTAIGTGAVALNPHSVAIGRGSYAPDDYLVSGVGTVIANMKIYFENGYAHKHNLPISTISIGDATPSNEEVELHGQDAFDARYIGWDSGTSYSIGDWRQNLDTVYVALTANLNKQPNLNQADWRAVWATSGGVPSDFNIDAGDMALYSGRATGSGESGSVNFYVGEGDNGQNVKDTVLKAGEFRSNQALTNGTHLYLFNQLTNTMQRVTIDPKPTVSGTNGVIGFSKGYTPE